MSGPANDEDGGTAAEPDVSTSGRDVAAPPRKRPGRTVSAVATGALALALGFGLTVQIRNTGDTAAVGQREEDLVRILDDLNAQEEQLREQIASRRQSLEELGSGQDQSARALEEAQQRAEAIAVLNGTVPARGPGLRVTIKDPEKAVTAAILLDAIQELRGAGAEAMQVDGVRIVVSSFVEGDPGELSVDGRPITAPYELRVIGPPADLSVALNVSGGVLADVARYGGSTAVDQDDDVLVDATVPGSGD
ncbi:DUF881 domain-containing protein [Blastococcus sp. PRF04-17]|uniref:DUF881 domain-containing protein n=1 Tax=Blastococcus sp. PRF04-17 TaxID=2933797 RepID=UPI001FF29A6E|nr:DUF881 domain-containing protein [Blastococcus sp. PRF04-17]UOY02138.1 DUF881 domain-containing protein [Blastococcus sp. PRF04-17]